MLTILKKLYHIKLKGTAKTRSKVGGTFQSVDADVLKEKKLHVLHSVYLNGFNEILIVPAKKLIKF